jgi:5-deoxy-5-amino-3-dehydroquinate synthase
VPAGGMTAALASVPVDLGDRSYNVLIGHGARHELSSVLPPSARRAAIVTQHGIGVAADPGIDHVVIEIGRGEGSKSLATVERICRELARAGISRSDVVVAVGGGLVTDVAGFAAASWHRGTPVVHVATTLLAQVDAAIGGKTGVNLPEGKNLVGAFWQPHAVICDLDTLATLPPEEWRSGYGEMAKYAFLGVEGLPDMTLEEQVRACVALKASVVAMDEREGSRRMSLNYGHTLAHALEAAGLAADGGDRPSSVLRHGEAVAVGLIFAARLAEALGRIDSAGVARHREVVSSYGLPMEVPAGADADQLLAFMARDKKAHGDLTFVLDGRAGVEPVSGVDRALVRRVLAEMIEEAR